MSTQPERPPSLSRTDQALLRDALENGYFEEPPGTSVRELAATHDLSEGETKRRLARGLAVLLKQYRSTEEGALPDGLVEEAVPWASAG